MPNANGKSLRLDPNAASASSKLPAFLARPSDAPVYHGFVIVDGTQIDGWEFGTITEFEDPNGCDYGDAFVIAPDGTRAGILWQVDDLLKPEVVCPPEPGRWGVYAFGYPTPIRTTEEFIRMCHSFLPDLRRWHAAATGGT